MGKDIEPGKQAPAAVGKEAPSGNRLRRQSAGAVKPAGDFHKAVPEGDELERLVCRKCGFINYENPKLIVGSVVAADDGRILLCRRAIQPRRTYWTLPAGFMELGESPEEGAMREAWEEARAKIEIRDLLAVYTVRHIHQIHLMYRARLIEKTIEPGLESLEVDLFHWDDIPWQSLAFPSVKWALDHYQEARNLTFIAPFLNPLSSDSED